MHEGPRGALDVGILDGYQAVAAGANAELGGGDDVVLEVGAHQREHPLDGRCVSQGLVGVQIVAAREIQIAAHLFRTEGITALEADEIADVLRPAQAFTQADSAVRAAVREELVHVHRLEVARAQPAGLEHRRRRFRGAEYARVLQVAARHQTTHGVRHQDDREVRGRPAGEPHLVEKHCEVRGVAVNLLAGFADHARFGIVVTENPQGFAPGATGVGNRVGDGTVPRIHEASEGVLIAFLFHQSHHRAFENVHLRLRARGQLELGGAEVEAVVGHVEGRLHLGLRHGVAAHVDDGVLACHLILASLWSFFRPGRPRADAQHTDWGSANNQCPGPALMQASAIGRIVIAGRVCPPAMPDERAPCHYGL